MYLLITHPLIYIALPAAAPTWTKIAGVSGVFAALTSQHATQDANPGLWCSVCSVIHSNFAVNEWHSFVELEKMVNAGN